MDSTDEIRPVVRPQFGGGHGGGETGGASGADADRADATARPRLDEVVLSEPGVIALQLLRHRVLERTRAALGAPGTVPPHIEFAPSLGRRAEVYVGRLLSEQNLLAALRRPAWSQERIAAALEEGMSTGVAETLEVLHEVGALDAHTWGLVCAVLAEFQRKVLVVFPAAGRSGSA